MRLTLVTVTAWVWIAACGSAESFVEGIGDAENAVFSEDGRLFVSGGTNAYEVIEAARGRSARPLYAGTCNFTGIVVRGQVLYTACVSGAIGQSPAYLLAAELNAMPQLRIIHEFERAVTPNGMTFDAQGRLFVADATALQSQLVVITLDAADPLTVASEQVWLGGFTFLNGLRYFDGTLYATDLNLIESIAIQPDGSPGALRVLASSLTVFDDLLPSADGILVADFLGGRLALYSLSGGLVARTAPLFANPSSVILGRAPLVPDQALLVTEKGEIGELESSNGNRVSTFRPRLQ
ncbi:MAG TPA: hypothetical protein VJR89_05385 [Polyangiales bacterium]|nr:hypothetical protein [Polyangiales bacterium]